eukprot:15459329-Alexandrium_andersonii.AAC.1
MRNFDAKAWARTSHPVVPMEPQPHPCKDLGHLLDFSRGAIWSRTCLTLERQTIGRRRPKGVRTRVGC